MRINMCHIAVMNHCSRHQYQVALVGDGNFKLEHMKMRHPEKDSTLSDGHGFFVTSASYDDHLRTSANTQAVRCLAPA